MKRTLLVMAMLGAFGLTMWAGEAVKGKAGMGADGLVAPEIGKPAPDFTLADGFGKAYALSKQKGKYVVLEWTNHGCPFVKKHYGTMNMQRVQKEVTGKGVVWFTIISSAPGKQGYCEPEEAVSLYKENGSFATAVLLDPRGEVGRRYGAKTTPHMFVMNPKGQMIYMGAIDDRPSANPKDVDGAMNYVKSCLEEAMAGKPVSTPSTLSYGCSVKY